MNVLFRPPALTPDEFERLPDHKGYELVDGQLREKGTGAESSEIQCELSFLLKRWVRSNQLGKVYESECMYRCFPTNPDRVRKPGVSFVRADRLEGGRSPTGIFLMCPDFAAEVISPRDTIFELDEKLADYADAEIPLVWVLHPNTRTADVYRPGQPRQTIPAAGELFDDAVLPGFRVRVGDLFPPPA